MEDLFIRMRQIVANISNGNAKAFARKVGIPYGTLQGYFRRRTPKAEHLSRMVLNADINANWLLAGRGSMLISEKNNEKSETSGFNTKDLVVDADILTAIISWLEERLAKEKKVLPPNKKATFIALAYEYFTYNQGHEEKKINEKVITNLFKLVA